MEITFTIEIPPEQIRAMFAALKLEGGQTPDSQEEKVTIPAAGNILPFPGAKQAPAAEADKTVTKDDIYKIALELSKAGKQPELLNVFNMFGAAKLSELNPADYAAVLDELKKIGG